MPLARDACLAPGRTMAPPPASRPEAAARTEVAAALREIGAVVGDQEASALTLDIRRRLLRGPLPASRREEHAVLVEALVPTAELMVRASPGLGADEAAECLWAVLDAAVVNTACDSRIARTRADEGGWLALSDKVWAIAIGEEADPSARWWLEHAVLAMALLVAFCLLIVWFAEKGRHMVLAFGGCILSGIFLLKWSVQCWLEKRPQWRRQRAFKLAAEEVRSNSAQSLRRRDEGLLEMAAPSAPPHQTAEEQPAAVEPQHPSPPQAPPTLPQAPSGTPGGFVTQADPAWGAQPAGPSQVDAFRAFGAGEPVGGPISATAARQGFRPQTAQADVAPPVAAGRPGLPEPYHPLQAGQGAEVRGRASEVLSLLNSYEAGQALGPYWTCHFWAAVAAPEEVRPFPAEIRRQLSASGYAGRATRSLPPESLREDLGRLATAPDPPLGNGLGMTPAATRMPFAGGGEQLGSSTVLAQEAQEWNLALPPNMRRAGAEIYRSIRSAGTTSVRNWLTQEYQGPRSGGQWVDLWTMATQADFALAKAPDAETALVMLQSDDALELIFRRLAAFVYEHRTKDRAGAQAMLAVTAPGSGADIAPDWLVQQVTSYSKAEHQRSERVAAASGGGRGGHAGPGGGASGAAGGRGGGALARGIAAMGGDSAKTPTTKKPKGKGKGGRSGRTQG